jgi:hypothetical protein
VIAGALLAAALARPARADELGGHGQLPDPPARAEQTPDERRATLEEMWQRRLLPPDQDAWNPQDMAQLIKIRRAENDALRYLRERFGGYRPWVAKPRRDEPGLLRLTKEGYEKYEFLLTQDAIAYFVSKGCETRDVFRLQDWKGRPVFDEQGRITEDGAALYGRAKRKLEAFWRGPDGSVYGTRRPPVAAPAPAAAPVAPAAPRPAASAAPPAAPPAAPASDAAAPAASDQPAAPPAKSP